MDQEDHVSRINLRTLPIEPSMKIFELPDYPSALFLSATCRSLHSSPRSPISFQSIADKNAFLVTAEYFHQHWTCSRNHACFHRSTMKPRAQFSKSQTAGLYNRHRPQGTLKFCLDCGVASGYYPPGHKVRTRTGVLLYKCGACMELKSGLCGASKMHSVSSVVRWLYCEHCEKCHDCLIEEYGPQSDRCPPPSCMVRDAERLIETRKCRIVFQELLPYSSVLEVTDEVFQPLPPPKQIRRRTRGRC